MRWVQYYSSLNIFGIAFLWDWIENWPFQFCGHCWVFQICWHVECSTLTASSFRIWNSSIGIPSPPLALFIVMLPKAHLTAFQDVWQWACDHTIVVTGSWRSFSHSSLYSFHLFIPFLSFIEPIFAWNVPLLSLIFLKRSLVFPTLLFSSISLHWLLRKAFSSLLALPWNSAFKWVYLSFSPLPLASLLSSAIFKASSDNHFAFLHLFFLGMVLITASYTMSWTPSTVLQALCLSDLILWIYLSCPLYNCKGFDLGHTWMV